MAGEKRGTALEGLVIQALICAKVVKSFDDVKWDEKIAGYRWKPDIWFCAKEKEFVFFVNYSGSETHSKEKFWRTTAELIDTKTANPETIAIAVFAGERLREKELQVTNRLLDATISLPDRLAGDKCIDDELDRLLDRGSKKTKIREALEEGICDEFCKAFGALLKNEIRFEIIQSDTTLHPLLQLNSKRPNLHISPRDTKTRLGLAKLALLDEKTLRAELTPEALLPVEPYMRGLFKLGLLSPLPKGKLARIADPDIVRTLKHNPNAGTAALAGITRTGVDSKATIWAIDSVAKGFCELREAICDKSENIFSDLPQFTFHAGFIYKIAKAWLAVCGSRQGSGWIEEVVDGSGILRSILVGTIFPPFERGETVPSHSLLLLIGEAIGRRIRDARKSATRSVIESDMEAVIAYILERELKDRMLCHGIDWGYAAICNIANDRMIPYKKYRLPSHLSSLCDGSANDFSTQGIVINSHTFVHCKSATQSGKDHKLKELCARGFFFRALLNTVTDDSTPCFLSLVLDGCWTPKDVHLLGLFGWDAVYMPDEIELLVSNSERVA